jgi:hypothetical protein
MKTAWIPVFGAPLDEEPNGVLLFKGGTRQDPTSSEPQPLVGLFVSNHPFSGGSVSAVVEFTETSKSSGCDLVLSYDARTLNTLNAGIPANGFPLFAIREYRDNNYTILKSTGDRMAALRARTPYHLKAHVTGSLLRLEVNGVVVLDALLSQPLTKSQVGLLCIDSADIRISDFAVESGRPKAFVVMQFSSPYNEVYSQVIRSVCDELGVEVFRVDESFSPGMIISDISRAILECTFVIADISPVNANVFYEVGYAHGRGKPTILIAERDTKLPFDVSPFRTLFYENSIGGKPRLEAGLRSAINAILTSQGAPSA